jgi:hypothetical protein
MAGRRPLRYPRPRQDRHYLVPQQRIPGYLPYAHPVGPGNIRVPNASSVDWPQAQFAKPWLAPGSVSFSPYEYPDYEDDVDLGAPMGAEFKKQWGPLLLFVAGFSAGYLFAKRDSSTFR